MNSQKLINNLEEVYKLISQEVTVSTVNNEKFTGVLHAFDPVSGTVALNIKLKEPAKSLIKIIPGDSVATMNST